MDESYFEFISAIFVEQSPFLSNLDTFWALIRINDTLTIECWIELFFSIESAELLSWIIFWTESWANQYWVEYWMTHFLAKFKHCIESDWVSDSTSLISSGLTRIRVTLRATKGKTSGFFFIPSLNFTKTIGLQVCLHVTIQNIDHIVITVLKGQVT